MIAAQFGWAARLSDGRVHRLRLRYLARGAQLEVYLDEMTDPLLAAPGLELDEVLSEEGTALVGFTAASGSDGAVHELLDWRLSAIDSVPLSNNASSTAPQTGGVAELA